MKKFLALLTALTLALSMSIPVLADEAAKEVKITVVHTNDVHSRVDGEAYVSSYVKGLKAAGENVVLISAGDVLHGQPLATIAKGKSIVDIMNAVGYDFMAPGNHDFNYGILRLNELVPTMNYDLLAANVISSATKKVVFKDGVIKEYGGVKVGFFGLSTPETATKTNPKNVEGVTFLLPTEVAADMVKKLQAEGAQVIVCVAHLGLDEETLPAERSEAVAAVKGIDLVIDGHSHTVLENGKQVENGALIAQTGEYLNNMGVVEIVVKDTKVSSIAAKLVAVPKEAAADWTPDAAIVAKIGELKVENEKITSIVIGKTPVKLEGERENARKKETNLANLITESMMWATGADMAITNGGGVRASIAEGDITNGDVLTVLPFGNFIATINVTGATVLEALEHGVDSYPELAGHYSQVGGMSVKFDSTKPAGERIVSVTLDDGTALDPAKTYKIATNDFMVAGGDNYSMFNTKDGYMEYGSLDEALIAYIATGVNLSNIKMGRMVDTAVATTQVPVAEQPAVEVPTVVAEPVTEQPLMEQPAVAETAEPQIQPITPEPVVAVPSGTSYTVVSGDALWKIAKQYNTTWQTLAEVNKLANPNLIFPGQVIVLP